MKLSRKARKLLSVVLTVVLAIGTFQFAPGVRTIAKAADAPEAGQSYTLNFAKAFSEKTQLNGYTSEDGVFKVIMSSLCKINPLRLKQVNHKIRQKYVH